MDNGDQRWSSPFSLLKSSPLQRVTIQDHDVPIQVTTAMLEVGLQRSVNTLIFTELDPASLTFVSHLGLFSSLKTLRCYTQCRWSGQCVFPPTDSDIEQLASGLPQLVILRMGHACRYRHQNTTIRSMISFSTHCLSSKELHLPCDLTNVAEDAKTESGEPDPKLEIRSPCTLELLAFGWIVMPPLDDIQASRVVVLALHHLFPCLWPTSHELEAVWKATLDTVEDS